MNTTIGKTFCIIGLCAASLLGAAADRVLFQNTFEEPLAGRVPDGWKLSWGKNGNDTFTVSNLRASEGAQSLLFARTSNEEQWGLEFVVPTAAKGVQTLSFDFLLDGSANQTQLYFEFRDKSGTFLGLALMGDHFQHIHWKPETKIRMLKWYRLELAAPLTPADGDKLRGKLTDLESGAVFVWEKALTRYPDSVQWIRINTQPGKKNFKVFFDNWKVFVND